MSNADENIKQVSNIKLSKDSYKYFKKVSIDKECTIQKVISEVLERIVSKKVNKEEQT